MTPSQGAQCHPGSGPSGQVQTSTRCLISQEVLSQLGPLKLPSFTPGNYTALRDKHRGRVWRGSDSSC